MLRIQLQHEQARFLFRYENHVQCRIMHVLVELTSEVNALNTRTVLNHETPKENTETTIPLSFPKNEFVVIKCVNKE